uniref:Arrestin C-terminal-like domain-containing protein n=1 Tax=Kalmanozyma brasiliensis (strain GHG001) TaxID=1365824 RepID=V5EYP1_KALBG
MSPPASVTLTQLEPVIFLRGQSSSGEDARGRRRPVNIDAPPSQLRGLVTLYLPKPSKIKEITVTLKGTARTDWPEGIGPNRVEQVEEMTIFNHDISLYNAKHDKANLAAIRPRSNSVGPGIGLQEDVDWDYAAARANARMTATSTPSRSPSTSTSRQVSSSSRKEEDRPKSSSGNGSSNLARQIAGVAAKAGTAIIPPTLRPDLGLSKPKDQTSSVEVQDASNKGSKGKSSSKSSNDSKTKKPGLKMLINGLLKEPQADSRTNHDEPVHSESKEFKKGTYTYPICISLPSNLPPTLHADFGFNRYVLRANVVRAGALTPNLVAEREVNLIHAPDEDALEETDSIVVERCWEDLLSYMVVFSGKSFPIGQQIPLWLKFVPLGKVKIYRILATLEERTDYFAKGRRVARHEVPRKWTLLKIGHASATEPILPILSDSADAFDQSPLAPLARVAAGDSQDSDALPSILDPTGPWELATNLVIPASGTTRINLSTNHSKSNIAVHHLIRLSIRVGKSDGEWEVWNDPAGSSSSAAKPTPQLFDIIIEAPITLTSSHTATDFTALPNYWSLPAEPVDQGAGIASHHLYF